MSENSLESKAAKILIVDDNEDNIDLAEQILEDDYEIFTAASGEACIAQAVEHQPDVILLDVQMPDMDGYETLAKMQEIVACQAIPVIFLSARYRDVDRMIHGLELGAMDYITKPVDDDLLMAKVKVAVRIKKAEDAVLAQSSALEAANKEMEAFTYSVSHDLRAPLRTLDGFSKILSEDYADVLDDDGKDYLQRIRAGSQRMGTLIDDLLAFSRTSRSSLRKASLSLSDMAEEIQLLLEEEIKASQAKITIQANMKAYADPRMMHIVLMNLLSNAVKYSRNEAQPVIEVGCLEQNEQTVFFVKDNGVGFKMVYADRLFQPFHRLHSSQEFEGNGIGLATVERITQRHQGKVWAESEQGAGATFYFTLAGKDASKLEDDSHFVEGGI